MSMDVGFVPAPATPDKGFGGAKKTAETIPFAQSSPTEDHDIETEAGERYRAGPMLR